MLPKNFKDWLSLKGILLERTAPYSPESDGRAERLNCTVLDMARTMLSSSKHNPNIENLWVEAVNANSYVRSRMYSSARNDTAKTPYEVLMKKGLNITSFKVFGAKAFVHTSKEKREGKINERAKTGYIVGYDIGNS